VLQLISPLLENYSGTVTGTTPAPQSGGPSGVIVLVLKIPVGRLRRIMSEKER
jgi:hypothetical protein